MEKLGINLGYLLVQIFNFFILFIVLRAWVYKPIMKLLETRKRKIAQSMEDARVAAEARANAEKEATGIIADAQVKAAHLISEATERADAAMVEARTESEIEISKEREAVLGEVEEERNRMLGDLRGQVAALAIAAAQKLIGEALDEQRQHALLTEFFSGIKSGKVLVLEGAEMNGTEAEVVSALPLTANEQATIRHDVLSKMGEQSGVAFRVDPAILGGLIIHIGDKVLDGSVAGQLQELRASLR